MRAAQPYSKFLSQASRNRSPATRQRSHHDTIPGIQLRDHCPDRVPQPPRHPMAVDSVTHGLRNDKTDPRSSSRPIGIATGVHHQVRLGGPHTVLDGVAELRRPRHPVPGWEHSARPVGQAVNERRPLRRRPDTMARPARVRIRKRKPCTRARRRLFGWKVRLPLATAPLSCHVRQTRPADNHQVPGYRDCRC